MNMIANKKIRLFSDGFFDGSLTLLQTSVSKTFYFPAV